MNNKILIALILASLVGVAIFFGIKKGVFHHVNYDQKLDTLFLGLTFGMDKNDFFARCKELNKQGLTIQGTQNTSVLYVDSENFKLPVDMNFYPNYHNDKIFVMPMYFNYKAWAPWNKELQSTILIVEVKSLLEKWFGEGFVEKKLKSGMPAYYKIDGPRIITLQARDEQFVDVLIENIKYAPKEKNQEDEAQ